jgi:hypothetical protein
MRRWRTKGDEIDGIEGNNDDQHVIAMLLCSLVNTCEQRTCTNESKHSLFLGAFKCNNKNTNDELQMFSVFYVIEQDLH